MSDYGPPSNDQIRQFRGSQARVAAWVRSQPASPTSTKPSTSRSQSHVRSRRSSTSRSSSRASLPPPPPGFKYASSKVPVVYKTQATTYTVIPSGTSQVVINSGRPPHTHRHTTALSPTRQQPMVTYGSSTPVTQQSFVYPTSHSKAKDKPLLRRLFGFGDSKKPDGRQRRHSTGGNGSNITIQW